VLYASTFSKIFAPGLRLAWMVVPRWAMGKLLAAKQTSDMQSASYSQRFIVEVLEDDFMERQVLKLRAHYRQQRDLMMAALKREFPAEVKYARPAGGMFVWCELPERLNATTLLEEALDNNVAYMPGAPFYHDGSGHNTLRLSYTLADEQQMNEGIAALSRIFKEAMAALR